MSIGINTRSTLSYYVDIDLSSAEDFPVVRMVIADSKGAKVQVDREGLIFEEAGDRFLISAILEKEQTAQFSPGALACQIYAEDKNGEDYNTKPDYTLTTEIL